MQLPITGLGALDVTDAMLNQKAATDPYIRLESQPFVMAGDVMLFIESNANDNSRSLIISRLYDNNKGDYTLSNVGSTQSQAATAMILYSIGETGLSVSLSKGDMLIPFVRRTTLDSVSQFFFELSMSIVCEVS